MANYVGLKAKQAALRAEAGALADMLDAGSAGSVEMARADALGVELAELAGQIDRVEALRAEQRAAPSPVESVRIPAQVRAEPDHFGSLGEMLVAVKNAAYGYIDNRLPAQAAILGGNESIASEGGYLVETALAPGIEKKLWEEDIFVGASRSVVLPAGANSMEFFGRVENSRADGSRYGGITGYRMGEGQTITPTGEQKFWKYTLKPKKYAAVGYLTDEVMRSVSLLASELEEGVTAELAFMLNDDLFRGAGTAGALGVTNHAILISAAAEDGQAADTVTYGNILEMWNRRWTKGSYRWYINQEVEQQLDQLYQAAGLNGLPPKFIDYGPTGAMRIKGCEVVVNEYSAALGDAGDIMLADFSQYRVGRIGGINGAMSPHVQFLTDQMCFRWTIMVDGQPTWKTPLTPYKATASRTVSPFIVLEAR